MNRLQIVFLVAALVMASSCGGTGGPAGKTDPGLDGIEDVFEYGPEPAPEPTIEPVPESAPEPAIEPVPEPAPEPEPEPVPEPAPDIVEEPPPDLGPEEIAPAVPLVTSVSPASGPDKGGNLVAVKGDFFQAGARVFFGEAEATDVTVGGQTLLACVAPAGAPGKVDVKVRNPDGQEGTLTAAYTYLATEGLTISSVSPSEGFVTGGNLVAVKGTGFTAETKVFFGETSALDVTVGGSTLLTCTVPAGAPGAVDVTVKNPDGAEAVIAGAYTYLAIEELTVTGVSPAAGPQEGGQVVMVTGTGFVEGTIVSFGDVAAAVSSVANPHVMVVTTPAHVPGLVDVSAKAPQGQTATLPAAYEFLAPGVDAVALYSVFPTSGPTGGGTAVVLKGQGFKAGAKALFGEAQAFNVSVEDAGLITCVTPKGNTGPVAVTVTNADGKSATLEDAFEYVQAEKLTVTSITPAKGPVEGGVLAMISGTGFEPGVQVDFGDVGASCRWPARTSWWSRHRRTMRGRSMSRSRTRRAM